MPWRKTSGSAYVAKLSLCASRHPVLPLQSLSVFREHSGDLLPLYRGLSLWSARERRSDILGYFHAVLLGFDSWHVPAQSLRSHSVVLQEKTRRKWARFRVRKDFNLCPSHYSPAFAFSVLSYPHCQQCSLRFTCLKAAILAYHVPNLLHDRVRVSFLSVARNDDVSQGFTEITGHIPFG